ncbi:type II toxin-antitoxin system CcdA family antitoxin [Rhodobacter sp. HX-7-19]|uniref:Type II toxin-antitoxin system CcdA family antitoxin n=2 Tax=Paragemmobacter kunshanensis TaxID=2583234 RepID=A0A6M1U2B6_9RHOB|nr:type II toxin-antitoxin system CcdA family antitoxin [Rhodobacter kunshanensis]
MSEGERGMERSGVVVPLVEDRAKAERNLLWREENRAALEAYAVEVAREGLALAAYRTF